MGREGPRPDGELPRRLSRPRWPLRRSLAHQPQAQARAREGEATREGWFTMLTDPYGAPPATLCDPHRVRDLNPAWRCDVPGCDCGSTPSVIVVEFVAVNWPEPRIHDVEEDFLADLRDELRHLYDLRDLDRELEDLRAEAKRLRDGPWLRFLRWLRRVLG